MLYKAGVIFGADLIDPNTRRVRDSGTAEGQLPETIKTNFNSIENQYGEYKAKIVEINGKKYIVRLLRTSNRVDPNATPTYSYYNLSELKGSEWNRFILPLVTRNRFDSKTSGKLEQALKNKVGEEYNIQLAKYNWFEDLTLYYESKNGNYCGQVTWTQDYTGSTSVRDIRGSYYINIGAAGIGNSSSNTPISPFGFGNSSSNTPISPFGFRPVLEEIN